MDRFISNDNTVFDSQTGLDWLKNANYFNRPMLWQEAVEVCAKLDISGGGWRLPERLELESLLDLTQRYPPLPKGHPFKEVQSSYYWSATTYTYNASYAWVVIMHCGYVSSRSKTYNHYYVWPVRGGQENYSNGTLLHR